MSIDELRAILRTARKLGITEDGFSRAHDVKAALDGARTAGLDVSDGCTSAHLVGVATRWLQDKGFSVLWEARTRRGGDIRDQPKVHISRPSTDLERNVSASWWCGDDDDGRAVAILQLISWVKP